MTWENNSGEYLNEFYKLGRANNSSFTVGDLKTVLIVQNNSFNSKLLPLGTSFTAE